MRVDCIMKKEFDNLINDPQHYIDEYFAPIINEIDLCYERNNDHNNPWRFELLDRIKLIKSKILDRFNLVKYDVDDIDEIKLMLTDYSDYTFKRMRIQSNYKHTHLNSTNFKFILLRNNEILSNYLDLSHCGICSIESDLFDGFPDLVHLNLNTN